MSLLFRPSRIKEYTPGELAPANHSATYLRQYHKAFVVSPKVVEDILSTLQNTQQSATITIATKGGGSHSFTSASELATFPNYRKERILYLAIRAAHSSETLGSLLIFTCWEISWSVALIVEGADSKQVNDCARRLAAIIEDTFQWHSFISNDNIMEILGIATIAIVLLGSGTIWLLSSKTNTIAPVAAPPLSWLRIARTAIIGLGCGAILISAHILVLVMFPIATFLIGNECDRYEKLKKIRWWAVTTIVCSILVPIVMKWLA